jgi:hypothetical protein
MKVLDVVNSMLAEGLSLREACSETDAMLSLPRGTSKRAVRGVAVFVVGSEG